MAERLNRSLGRSERLQKVRQCTGLFVAEAYGDSDVFAFDFGLEENFYVPPRIPRIDMLYCREKVRPNIIDFHGHGTAFFSRRAPL
jgi:hypothetical protein